MRPCFKKKKSKKAKKVRKGKGKKRMVLAI
jgi:hypothetical protein